jgi:hypothetical protein
MLPPLSLLSTPTVPPCASATMNDYQFKVVKLHGNFNGPAGFVSNI